VMVTRDAKTGKEINMHASKGTCFKTPPNTAHAIHAITESTCISMLTKEWDKCNPPIIHEDIIPFDKDYLTFVEDQKRTSNKE